MLVSGDSEELSRKFLKGMIDEINEERMARASEKQRHWWLKLYGEELCDLKPNSLCHWFKPAHCTFCWSGGIKLRCRSCAKRRRAEHIKSCSAGADPEYTDNPLDWCVDCGRERGAACRYGLRCRDCSRGGRCFCHSEICPSEDSEDSQYSETEESDLEASEPVKEQADKVVRNKL